MSKQTKSKAKSKPAQKIVSSSNIAKKSFIEKIDNKTWWYIGFVTLVAFILRVWGAGRVSFWFDEFLHVLPAADFIRGRGLNNIDGFNGVFTTWVEIIAMGIFGINETVARTAMALFAASSIFPIYFVAKKLFNTKVAFTTIIFFAVSLYAVYWGRTVRNYATFLPFYFWMHYLLLNIFEGNISEKNNFEISSGIKINLKTAGLFLLSFIISILNHQLTIFIFFGWILYGSIVWIGSLSSSNKKLWNKYTLFIPLLASFGFIFTQAGNKIAKQLLSILLPENIVNGVIPNMERVKILWNEKTYESFDVYWRVLTTDGNYLYLLAILGLILAFIKYKRSAIYILSHFVFIFILFSFVFREPAVSRYLYFILPFYFMAASYFIWWLLEKVFVLVFKKQGFPNSALAMIIAGIIAIGTLKPSNLQDFLKNKEHGQIVDFNLSEWYYTNWKDPSNFVKQNMKEGDVILSTVPNAARLYLELDTSQIGWFRQMHYDGTVKKYVENDPLGKKVSGYTTEEFINTVKNNPRGWLLADYYFYNVMTDANARQYAIENLDFHFNASKDGSVQVFSWDNSKPKTDKNPVLIELGKSMGQPASDELNLNLALTGQEKVNFIFDAEGIDVGNEAVIQFNNGQMLAIPKPQNAKGYGREYSILEVPTSYLQNGQNSIRFYYNPDAAPTDIRQGFVIYNVIVQ